MPNQTNNQWPSGLRDTTEFPNISLQANVSIREHLAAFSKMQGVGWNDYDTQRDVSSLNITDQRLRSYRKMYEKMGLVYKENDTVQLSLLGTQIASLQSELDAKAEAVLSRVRTTAISILSRYQLQNPVDRDVLPEDCDIQPCVAIWKAMHKLNGKIHYEEMNRTVLRVMRMADLDTAIERIRAAREHYGNYAEAESSVLDSALGAPVHTEQVSARIAPWFSFAGWGGLIIERNSDADGFRHFVPASAAFIEQILSDPPTYYEAQNEDDWIRYYIGEAANNTVGQQENGDNSGNNRIFAADNEDAFRAWLATLVKANGEHYSENTRNQYMSAMRAVSTEFADVLDTHDSIFSVNNVAEFDTISTAIRESVQFEEVNRARGNGALSACLSWYRRFLEEAVGAARPVCFATGYNSTYSRNRILFGAPGTGKSFTLNGDRKELLYGDRDVDEDPIDHTLYGEYERVTFHPDYSYANFVGTYKPVPCTDSDGKDAITYSYVPGPFMRTYVKALRNSRTDTPKPYLLVIEEINRANVAAVFGDVFQLLDRGDDEVSEYPIQASEDIKKYLAAELGGNPDDYSEIRIPDNMFIWATMNSADQGVFPMDTAFKRRWDFTYLGIDDSEAGIAGKKVVLGQGDYCRVVEWNELRKAINNELLTYKVNEDKLMGPYFISKKNLPEGDTIDPAVFSRIFKNKVIMYLFDDAAKQKRITLFGGCDEKAKNQYSKICSEFDTKGVFIFCEAISSQFIPEDDKE